jgi:hypothetical protein
LDYIKTSIQSNAKQYCSGLNRSDYHNTNFVCNKILLHDDTKTIVVADMKRRAAWLYANARLNNLLCHGIEKWPSSWFRLPLPHPKVDWLGGDSANGKWINCGRRFGFWHSVDKACEAHLCYFYFLVDYQSQVLNAVSVIAAELEIELVGSYGQFSLTAKTIL